MDRSQVILVNEQDEALGVAEKMEAHRQGLLHRAFSIFIFNERGEMLLQRRAMEKYHSGGLWTNACCSHPLPGLSLEEFAHIRLREEMGFDTPLKRIFHHLYQAPMENGLIEHEFDHVLEGTYNGSVHPDPSEVMEYQFLPAEAIRESMDKQPQRFTAWFRMIFPLILDWQAKKNDQGQE